jgi:hypothetical protein
MVVEANLTSSPARLTLLEPEDLGSLKVLVLGAREGGDGLAEALDPVGRLDDTGHALLGINGLKELAGDRVRDEEWLAAFDAMVDYARSKGWVSADGQCLQAHCEWQADNA